MIENLVSIIMPVYNIEVNILKRSIDSVCSQTYNNWELFVINDGSDYNYDSLIEKYSTDSRIHYLITANFGVSHARNIGIKKSKGEFVVFIDPDDFITHDFITQMMNVANLYKSDLCVCNYSLNKLKKINKNNIKLLDITEIEKIKIGIIGGGNCIDGTYYVTGAPWGKLYSNKIIQQNSLLFDEELPRSQDIEFNFRYMHYANNIILLSNPMYIYTVSNNSAMRKYWPNAEKNAEIFLKKIKNDIEVYSNNSLRYKEAYIAIVLQKYVDILNTDICHHHNKLTKKQKINRIKKLNNHELFEELRNYNGPFKYSKFSNLILYLLKKNYILLIYSSIEVRKRIKGLD